VKKEITKEELRKLCIDRYDALHVEDNYKKGNKLENAIRKEAEILILEEQGVKMMYDLLFDEDDRVRYQIAGIISCLYPKECIKVFKEIQKNSKYLLSTDAKYAILAIKEGENDYYMDHLKKHGKYKR
jgi:hypothetical protein